MKKIITLIGMMAIIALIAGPVNAAPGTLYEQEGIVGVDGPAGIDASGHGPAGDAAKWTNWKYQYGGGSWSGVYAGDDAWQTESESGDMNLEIEADIEMYMSQWVGNNKIYFHLGNLYSATAADKTAYVDGGFTSNNGMYVGISFNGLNKIESDFLKDGSGLFTGRICNAMQSDNDTWRAQDNQMDIEIFLNAYLGDGWQVPVAYGDGSHATQHDTLWWLVNGGAPGTYSYKWLVRLLPDAHQPDGDYYLDPAIVAAPVL